LSALAILTDATGIGVFRFVHDSFDFPWYGSHDPQQMRFMDFGLAVAIMAGTQKDRILNFLSAEELQNWVATLRCATSFA
jgi:hypothetical protein